MMSERVVPDDLNWAELEAKWGVDSAFDKLKRTVERDAKASKKPFEEDDDYDRTYFCVKSSDKDQFVVRLVSPSWETGRCARISKTRRSQTIDVELLKLDRVGIPLKEFYETLTFEPRINDYGEQTFAEIDTDRKTSSSLLYPWQVNRQLVDKLRASFYADQQSRN